MIIGTNFPIRSEYSPTLRGLIDAQHDPFKAFAAAELDYVELAQRQDRLNLAALRADVDALHERGLQVNLHPYYRCRDFGTPAELPHLRPNVRAVLEIAEEIAQAEGRQVVVNFHAASGYASREGLLAHSYAFHDWLMETVHAMHANVLITTEHQLPPKVGDGYQRIGDRFSDLLDLRAHQPDPHFFVCWDMGHSAMRHAYYGDALHPPAELLPLVKHVHIHDVDFSQPKDHRLIGTGDSPLQAFVTGLLAAGYGGGFTMEYDPDEFFGAEYADFLRRSKSALLHLAADQLSLSHAPH